MSGIVRILPDILAEGEMLLSSGSSPVPDLREIVEAGGVSEPANRLIHGDNLPVMQALVDEGLTGSVDLIYGDPPFESNRHYHARLTVPDGNGGHLLEPLAYTDRWEGGLEGYLRFMTPRLMLMHRLLKETGSLYLHVDSRISHYLKLILDGIFGRENFRNEIVWQRDSAGKGAKGTARQWSRENDHILFYSKAESCYFRPVYRDELTETQLREYIYQDPDGRRFKKVQLGDYSQASITRLREENRIHTTSTGREYKKYYLDEARFPVGSNWTDIVNLSKGQVEQSGYPTQKPEKLLSRIIRASCPEDGLVADFFCGAGTAGVAASRLGRPWIMVDAGAPAMTLCRQRLAEAETAYRYESLRAAPAGETLGLSGARNAERLEITLSSYTAGHPVMEVAITPLDLLSYWSVDPAYDGKTFRARHQFCRVPGRNGRTAAVPLTGILPLPVESGATVCVRAMDCYGNEAMGTLRVNNQLGQ